MAAPRENRLAHCHWITVALAVLRRDLILAYRNRAELTNPWLFFIMMVSLFPLGINPDQALLQTIAPGIIWIAALLAALLSLESLFRADFEEGVLEQFFMSAHSPTLIILMKVFAHWLVTGLPLILIAPILAMILYVPWSAWGIIFLTLVLGTPVLSLIGAIGMALTVGLRRGGLLIALLVLPLYIPVLIFATSAIAAVIAGMSADSQLLLLAALFILALTLAPLAITAALRMSLEL